MYCSTQHSAVFPFGGTKPDNRIQPLGSACHSKTSDTPTAYHSARQPSDVSTAEAPHAPSSLSIILSKSSISSMCPRALAYTFCAPSIRNPAKMLYSTLSCGFNHILPPAHTPQNHWFFQKQFVEALAFSPSFSCAAEATAVSTHHFPGITCAPALSPALCQPQALSQSTPRE